VSPRATGRWILAALVLRTSLPAVAFEPPERKQRADPVEAGLAEEIDRLLVDLGEARTSWQAMHRLVEIGPPAVEALEDRILLADPMLRRTVVTTLSWIEGAESSPLFEVGLVLSLADAVENLRHDSVPWNASNAMYFLRRHAEAARPLLEAVLDSEDHQQRQMAAAVLRRIKSYRPTPRMLEVTVEGLGDDVLPVGRRPGDSRVTTTYVFNAADGVRWFLRDRARIRAAELLLLEALWSDDYQQCFLAAYLLGVAGCTSAPGDVFRVLAPHLADNEIRSDANMAAAGLYGLGPAIVPTLRARLRVADPQEEILLRLLIHHLVGADDPDAAVPPTTRRREITDVVRDPVVEHRFVRVPRGLRTIHRPPTDPHR